VSCFARRKKRRSIDFFWLAQVVRLELASLLSQVVSEDLVAAQNAA
jgi:hypothetical protein